ncbi:PREDICTED: coiled-coil domain-containing protein 116 [Chrysochloris asiatica]|uniref:Coiled-coil domain-containing protein 116 n=1 Tax=Chrysochloris asiatica TaxID=185453 RepID=A0A9B0X0Z3_CHRAS|nr:PREDICTED: coiled-coil domain-containing protein 116 [Chrysochloris asiatica]
MAKYRHHSGYLADDEAGHTTYVARVQPPRKPLFPEMGSTSKLVHEPHPPSLYEPSGSSALRGHRRSPWGTQPFGSFLDFLTEGQVLDSLQTVVEEATERMATVRTEAGEPLVEVQDPMEMPSKGRPMRVRPNLSTVHRHRTRPNLCTGHLNNYPSCSSSAPDSHSSLLVGGRDRDSDQDVRGVGSLPPMKDRLLLERNLKRLLRLENKGKSQSKPSSQRYSLLWDSLDSQASSQWTLEQPLSWFSELLGSDSGTPAASELGTAQRELVFLKREFNKEMRSLQNQPASFDLPGYCSAREPHRTLDFLAEHHLFPALQHVVGQAVNKLSGARRHDGRPLFFPAACEPSPEPEPPPSSQLSPDSMPTSPEEDPAYGGEFYELFPTVASNLKMDSKKNVKGRIRNKVKEEGSPVSGTQVATKLRLKNPRLKFSRKKRLSSISSKSTESHFSFPWEEEFVNFLVEQATSLLLYKYKFERNLNKQLGFISFPVTEVLLDLFLGFKKVEGSSICLSSKIDWTCLLRKLEETKWTHQPSQHTSQHSTSRISESPYTLPKPNTNKDEATVLNTEQLNSQEPTAEDEKNEEEHTSPSELKLSISSSTGTDLSPTKSKKVVYVDISEGNEENEDGDKDSSRDKTEPLGLPEPTVQDEIKSFLKVNHSMPLMTPHLTP